MMRIKINKYFGYWALSATGLMIASPIYATTSLWTLSAPTPTSVTVADDRTATFKYTVTNQSNNSKNLILQTTPGLSAPVCHLAAT